MAGQVKRGEVYYADLTGHITLGSEQKGIRPVLIIQNDVGNKHSPTVIVAAITKAQKKEIPTHVHIQLREPSIVLCEQIFTISKERLLKKICTLDEKKMKEIDYKIKVSLGLVSISVEEILKEVV